uniref:Clathrin light chain n=1 Tax=Panagrellus redivivus TaxID=6233 RepID=A0A7E4VFL4_PANRE
MADPVAAFLERESGFLADLDGTEPPAGVDATANDAGIPEIDVIAPAPVAQPIANGLNHATTNNDSGVDLGGLDLLNGGADPIVVSNGSNGAFNGTDRSVSPSASDDPVFHSKPDVEPASVSAWREAYEKNLTKLDEEEEKAKAELKAKARQELEDFEKKRASDLAERKKVNREKQIEFLKNVEKASAGVLWQRIAKVVEADEKTPKLSVDTDRMRQLMLQGKDGGPTVAVGSD